MTNHDAEPPKPTVSPLPPATLAWVFLKLGCTAFGGLGAALAIIERELVTRRGVLTQAELTEALTYTKLLPGSTVVQVVAYLGHRLGGWLGSAAATVAFVLPSAVAMTALAVLYVAVIDLPGVVGALKGLAAAVVGLLAATTIRLGQSGAKGTLLLLIAGAAFAANLGGVNAAVVVILAGAVGLFLPASATAAKPQGDAKP